MSGAAIDTLVIAIVQDEDADDLLSGLRAERVGATKIGSSGGFLRTSHHFYHRIDRCHPHTVEEWISRRSVKRGVVVHPIERHDMLPKK